MLASSSLLWSPPLGVSLGFSSGSEHNRPSLGSGKIAPCTDRSPLASPSQVGVSVVEHLRLALPYPSRDLWVIGLRLRGLAHRLVSDVVAPFADIRLLDTVGGVSGALQWPWLVSLGQLGLLGLAGEQAAVHRVSISRID